MTDAPKQIFACDCSGRWNDDSGVWGPDRENTFDEEYHRADLSADLVRAGYLAGLEDAGSECDIAAHVMSHHGSYDEEQSYQHAAKSIRALSADPKAIAAIVASVVENNND